MARVRFGLLAAVPLFYGTVARFALFFIVTFSQLCTIIKFYSIFLLCQFSAREYSTKLSYFDDAQTKRNDIIKQITKRFPVNAQMRSPSAFLFATATAPPAASLATNASDAGNVLVQTRARMEYNINQKKDRLAKIKATIKFFLCVQELSSPEMERDLKRVLSFNATESDFQCMHRWSDQMQRLIHQYRMSLKEWIDFHDQYEDKYNEELQSVLFNMAKKVNQEIKKESDDLSFLCENSAIEENDEKAKSNMISGEESKKMCAYHLKAHGKGIHSDEGFERHDF